MKVQAVLERIHASYAQVLERFFGSLKLRGRHLPLHIREDLAQEVFTRLARLKDWSGVRDERLYVCKTAVNVWNDFLIDRPSSLWMWSRRRPGCVTN